MRSRLGPLLPLIVSLPFWAATIYVVRTASPEGWTIRLLFLSVLAVSLALTLTPAFQLAPQLMGRRETASDTLGPAARRGAIAALAATVMIWLRMERILDPLNALLLVAAVILIEFVILQR
ncbi:MAG: hypothetical protein ACE5NC_01225 [Anaerolineae bacterium]